VNARPALAKIGVEAPPAGKGEPPRKKKAEGLPMPRMHEETSP
jgi:hypothetical protein